MGRTEDREPLLQIRDVTKRFGALIANDRIHMTFTAARFMPCLVRMGRARARS